MMIATRDWVLRELKQANTKEAVKERGYISCSGIDTRELARLFHNEMDCGYAFVGGPACGSIMISQALSDSYYDVDGDRLYLPFYVRKAEKNGKLVCQGFLGEVVDYPVIIVDDVLSTGYSIVKAAKAVEKEWGYKPTLAVVLVDNEVGGKEFLKTKGIECKSIFTRKEILNA